MMGLILRQSAAPIIKSFILAILFTLIGCGEAQQPNTKPATDQPLTQIRELPARSQDDLITKFGIKLFELSALKCFIVRVDNKALNALNPNGGGCTSAFFQRPWVEAELAEFAAKTKAADAGRENWLKDLSAENTRLREQFLGMVKSSKCAFAQDPQNFEKYFSERDTIEKINQTLSCLGSVEISRTPSQPS